MSTDLEYVKNMFETTTNLINKATDGISADQWLKKPDDLSNNLLWVVGHLAWSRANILRVLGAEEPAPWAALFGRGSKPAAAADYPTADDVCETWKTLSARLSESLAKVSPDVLSKPHDKPTFDGTVAGFVAFLAFHEAYHAGQASYLRKWLGHGQAVG